MPLFYKLDGLGKDTARVAGRLEALRQGLQTHPDGPQRSVPNKNATDTLLLATWNLKEFEGGKNDNRTAESYWYIAEIISDLVAIQEVGAHLGALNRLQARLGRTWKFVASDVTEGSAGNQERLAFLFDRRKIRFSGVAGEIVIPPIEDTKGNSWHARPRLSALRPVGSALCCPPFTLSGARRWPNIPIAWPKFRPWPGAAT
jgi:hypothetical protein